MNKRIIMLFAICTVFINAYSQTRIGINVLLSTPKSDTYVFGSGFSFNTKFNVAKNLALGATISYEHFFNKSGWENDWEEEWGYSYQNNNSNIAQLHPSVTYFLSQNKIKSYVGFEMGVTFEFVAYEYKNDYSSGSRWLKVDNTETSFSFSPVLGLEVPVSENLAFDFFIKYTGIDVSYFSAGIGLAFAIK